MLYIVDKTTGKLKAIEPSTFEELKIWERKDLEKWVENNPELLGEDLFVISTEYDKFDRSNDRLDVLAVDKNGKLVVIELKRDIAPTTTEMQAIKYAAFCSNFTLNDVIEIYVERKKSKGEIITEEDARDELMEFVQDDSFDEIDNKPRIILVAREYKQETTSSILWLRSFGLDISCVKLELHSLKDETGRDTVAINSSIIIPLPDAKEYLVDRERKETEIAEMTKSQKFHRDLFNRLIERFKEECPGITERTGSIDSWLGLPIGYNCLHFEWTHRKRPEEFYMVSFDLEKSDAEENKRILQKVELKKKELEYALGEELTFEYNWGKRGWCRMYVANNDVENLATVEDWIIETTKKFYQHVKPEIDQIMKE